MEQAGDQGQHAHERLGQHGSIADEAGVGFLVDELGSRSRGHQRVKAGDGSAGNGDEEEWEELARG